MARLLAARGDRVALLGRHAADLDASASDLAARAPAGSPPPATVILDLARPETFDAALDEAAAQLGGLDTVVITAGAFGTQDALEADVTARERVLTTNFTQTIQFCEAARVRLIAAGGGTLCVLGSVAGDRARKPVVLYGATKAGLAYYMHGIDLRYRDAGLRGGAGQARVRADGDDGRPARAAVRGQPGRRRAGDREGDRSRHAAGLRAGDLAPGDAGDSVAARCGDATGQILGPARGVGGGRALQRSGSNRARRVGSSAIVTVGIVALSAGLLARAGRVPPAAAPAGAPQAPATVSPPLTPAEALQTFRLPPGYRLELVASEPLVADPVWMDMDPDGRLWVVEMRGFMPNFEGTGEDAPVGQVVVLEDTDDDGRADKRTVFLDGLVQPRTVKVLDRGVLVIAPPQLILARDTDGDLKADTREVLRTDVGVKGGNPEHSPNSLLWGLDNWLYTSEYATDFRWTRTGLESAKTLSRGQWGISMDDTRAGLSAT